MIYSMIFDNDGATGGGGRSGGGNSKDGPTGGCVAVQPIIEILK